MLRMGAMEIKTADAIKEFGDPLRLAAALGITRAAIYQWGETVPALRAYQIQELRRRKQEEPHKEAA